MFRCIYNNIPSVARQLDRDVIARSLDWCPIATDTRSRRQIITRKGVRRRRHLLNASGKEGEQRNWEHMPPPTRPSRQWPSSLPVGG